MTIHIRHSWLQDLQSDVCCCQNVPFYLPLGYNNNCLLRLLLKLLPWCFWKLNYPGELAWKDEKFCPANVSCHLVFPIWPAGCSPSPSVVALASPGRCQLKFQQLHATSNYLTHAYTSATVTKSKCHGESWSHCYSKTWLENWASEGKRNPILFHFALKFKSFYLSPDLLSHVLQSGSPYSPTLLRKQLLFIF